MDSASSGIRKTQHIIIALLVLVLFVQSIAMLELGKCTPAGKFDDGMPEEEGGGMYAETTIEEPATTTIVEASPKILIDEAAAEAAAEEEQGHAADVPPDVLEATSTTTTLTDAGVAEKIADLIEERMGVDLPENILIIPNMMGNSTGGEFDDDSMSITINPSWYSKPDVYESALYHEIVHYFQELDRLCSALGMDSCPPDGLTEEQIQQAQNIIDGRSVGDFDDEIQYLEDELEAHQKQLDYIDAHNLDVDQGDREWINSNIDDISDQLDVLRLLDDMDENGHSTSTEEFDDFMGDTVYTIDPDHDVGDDDFDESVWVVERTLGDSERESGYVTTEFVFLDHPPECDDDADCFEAHGDGWVCYLPDYKCKQTGDVVGDVEPPLPEVTSTVYENPEPPPT